MSKPVKADLPPLHPDRVKGALRAIDMEREEDEKVFDTCFVETFEAALKIIDKSQRALNLTGETATAIGKAQEFLQAIARFSGR